MNIDAYLKPADGLVVRDPVTRESLPADGKTVTLNTYWRRRLDDGDVVTAKQTRRAAAKPVNKKEKD